MCDLYQTPVVINDLTSEMDTSVFQFPEVLKSWFSTCLPDSLASVEKSTYFRRVLTFEGALTFETLQYLYDLSSMWVLHEGAHPCLYCSKGSEARGDSFYF